MDAPYRSPSAPDDGRAEAREIEAFARAMHAERRVWGNEHLGQAIAAALLSAAPFTVCHFDPSAAFGFAPVSLVVLAFSVHHFRAWRAAIARRRADHG